MPNGIDVCKTLVCTARTLLAQGLTDSDEDRESIYDLNTLLDLYNWATSEKGESSIVIGIMIWTLRGSVSDPATEWSADLAAEIEGLTYDCMMTASHEKNQRILGIVDEELSQHYQL